MGSIPEIDAHLVKDCDTSNVNIVSATILDFRDFDKKICRINESLEFFQRISDEEVEIDEKLTFSEERSEYVKKYGIPSETGVSEYYLGICAPSNKVDTIKKELAEFQKYLKSM